jgi:hypothetical protein
MLYSLIRATCSVALNEAERVNARMIFEIKKLFALANVSVKSTHIEHEQKSNSCTENETRVSEH